MDLSVPSFAQHDAQVRRVAFHAEPRDLRGLRRTSVDLDARPPPRQVVIFDDALDLREVNFRRLLAWMQQPQREVAVVREQQRARGTEIEPTHRNDARAGALEILGDRRAPSGIGHRADHVPRFVENQVDERLAGDGSPVDFDAVSLRVRARAELGDDAPIHRDASGDDELLGFAPRSNAAPGQDLL
jgi:hypothetical protein